MASSNFQSKGTFDRPASSILEKWTAWPDPKFQFNVRYVLLTIIPAVAILSLSAARLPLRVLIALGIFNLVAIAVLIRFYRSE